MIKVRFAIALLSAAATAAGCSKDKPAPADTAEPPGPESPGAESPKAEIVPAAIAHGGVGSPPDRSDGCRKAVDAALAALEAGADPMDAAVAGVKIMEDDPRFNAGTGSYVRLDGETVQMDASIMNSQGQFGAIAVIEHVQNPIDVARAVIDTPHLLLAGDGATRFARALGVPEYNPATEDRLARSAKLRKQLAAKDPKLPEAWRNYDWQKAWNFETSLREAGFGPDDLGGDTVGVAVRGADGSFAVALSTGGWTLTMRGRVGDVPVLGAGLFASPAGAAAATGSGERIIENLVGKTVVSDLEGGKSPLQAAEAAVDRIRGKGSIGVIVISKDDMTAAADRNMAWAARELGSKEWKGPDPDAAD